MIAHTGNIYSFAEALGLPVRKVTDFSASINPLGVSKKVKTELRKHLKHLNNYPDPDCSRFSKHLSKHLNIPEDNIICSNGSTELVYLLVRTLLPEKVLILAPTFLEYERAVVGACSCKNLLIESLCLREEKNFQIDADAFIEAMGSCKMAFLCNPNNPTAQLLTRDRVMKIAEAARETGCYLVVDEAFIEFVPDETVVTHVPENPYLIVLRSMTKFYALSGLRLGYGIFPSEVAKGLKKHKEPWTVNTLAQRAGVVALKDKHYRSTTFEYLKKEKHYFEKEFEKLGISFYPSKINYYLLKHEEAQDIAKALYTKAILVRDCSNFKGLDGRRYLRVAIKTHGENALLIKELRKII